MRLRFVDRTNAYIDRLVRIAWETRASHEGEYIRVPRRDEAEIDQLINDEIEIESEGEALDGETPRGSKLIVDLSKFSTARSFGEDKSLRRPPIQRLLIAVDTGVVNLGEFVGGGLAFALRGAAICLIDDQVTVLQYNTGPLLIDGNNQVPVFRYVGKRLGNEELYLARDDSGDYVPRPSAFETGNQTRDRCRNFVERMIQEEALSILSANKRGILLVDGALPAGTFDTPTSYLQDMLNRAVNDRIDIAAVSKKSRITIGGRPISALFDDQPNFVGYAPLKEIMAEERSKYVEQGIVREASAITLANELFAVRFGLGPPSLTFRVDVHNSIRSTPFEVIADVFSQCQIQGCYPRPLIEAHQFGSFLFQDVQTLTADLIARTGARPKEDPSMEWMFSPFGASRK
jgi:hypothetical protein